MSRGSGALFLTKPLLPQALWNLRFAGLFILIPGMSVIFVGLIFGLSHGLQLMASAMFILAVGLFSILVGAEYRSLRDKPPQR